VRGGRIFLDLRESANMLARALGHYEVEKMRMLERHLTAGSTFVDVGVNKGDFSILAASLVGPQGRVLGFEPDPENLLWTGLSISLNGYTNIRLFELALCDEEGIAPLYLGEYSGHHSLIAGQPQRSGETREVRTRRLDDVLREEKVTRVDAIKIDTEGAELAVLDGATRTLAETPDLMLLVDIHPPVTTGDVAKRIEPFGYHLLRPAAPPRPLAPSEDPASEICASRHPLAQS